jgi:hypothetical protein
MKWKLVKVSHVHLQQSLWKGFWDTWEISIYDLVHTFIMDQWGCKLELPGLFLFKSSMSNCNGGCEMVCGIHEIVHLCFHVNHNFYGLVWLKIGITRQHLV